MGYENYETNIKALGMTRGNLDKAMELILENSDCSGPNKQKKVLQCT